MKIATLNTWKNDGDYHKRVALICQETERLNPDVLFLQEDFSTTDKAIHTAKRIATSLGYNYHTSFTRLKNRTLDEVTHSSYSGLAVLTKGVEATCFSEDLPTTKEDGGRTVQFCHFSIHSKQLVIANVHFTHIQDPLLKAKQVAYVLNHPAIQAAENALILGDFNMQPDHPVLNAFTEHQFKSIFAEEVPPLTFPASNAPKRTLDYIYIKSTELSIKNKEVCYNTPTQERYPSDHFGLFVDFKTEKEHESH